MSVHLELPDDFEVLSRVLASSRVQGRLLCHKVFRGNWGLAFPPGNGMRFHLVVQGHCWWRDSPTGVFRELEKGELVLVSQSTGHELVGKPGNPLVDVSTLSTAELWSSPPEEGDSSGFSGSYLICGDFSWTSTQFPPVFDALPSVVSVKGQAGRPAAWLTPVLELLAIEGRVARPSRSFLVERYLELLLILTLRHIFDERPSLGTSRWFQALAHPAVARALAMIHQSPHNAWTVATLSEGAGSSRAAFSKQFSRLLGMAPMGYLTWWRMQTARRLLKDQRASLKEVANQVGYGSVYSFSKAFKQTFGESPGRFRDPEKDDGFSTRGG